MVQSRAKRIKNEIQKIKKTLKNLNIRRIRYDLRKAACQMLQR